MIIWNSPIQLPTLNLEACEPFRKNNCPAVGLRKLLPNFHPIIPFFNSQRIFLLFFLEEKLFPRMLPIILKQIKAILLRRRDRFRGVRVT